jgi:hypothetical protein
LPIWVFYWKYDGISIPLPLSKTKNFQTNEWVNYKKFIKKLKYNQFGYIMNIIVFLKNCMGPLGPRGGENG